MPQPVHTLEPCRACHIYHCRTCGCPRARHQAPSFPNTEQGNADYVQHRLPAHERVKIDAITLMALAVLP